MPASKLAGNSSSSTSIVAAIGALTGGLLSSSCCVLQLLLNYTSIGCAGFSVLTPYANYFRLLTGGFMSYLLYTQGLSRRTVSTVALSFLLMISQDVLKAHNTGALQQLLVQYQLLPPSGTVQQEAASQQQQQQQKLAVVAARRTLLRVQGMRCEGCAALLRGNLAAVPGVDSCNVQFAAGTVEVWSNGTTQGVTSSMLLSAVHATDSSYKAEVLGRECYDEHDEVLQPCPEAQQAAAPHLEEVGGSRGRVGEL